MADIYDPKAIEAKWQERWLNERLFAMHEEDPKTKMYVLDMFPYPSGEGLHVGHVKIYTASDVVARYMRMKGFNVLHPTGWDAFGLPTENSAIKLKIHPAKLTERNIGRFRGQMRRLGLSYDWDREINTTDPDYYKWTQWIFLQLFRMGLAYEATVPINWCPGCKTGLANEEVVEGKCERCGTAVEERPMRQWMLRITKYADRLLEGLGGVSWPNSIKELQKNWIGRSEGLEIIFDVDGRSETIPVFTTRPDTLFGVTYLVLSPQHPLVASVTTAGQAPSVAQYLSAHPAQVMTPRAENPEKSGVFTGAYAIHPVTHAKLPIWIADYVLMSYGTGAIMAVPAHDQRDFDFARLYSLPVKTVIVPVESAGQTALPYMGAGVLIDSAQFDGQKDTVAREAIASFLQLQKRGRRTTHYALRDWVFSRQRYWGEPIPLIHCEKCGVVPVRDEDLPVELPLVENYEPTGTGESPLAAIKEWVEVKCPTCPGIARRETNTMPQWAGSSWYWLRYLSPHFTEGLAQPETIARWLPVDVYVGGAEHAVLHLLYARFWHKVLFDAGVTSQEEPFRHFRAVGLVLGEDGQKMSKSRGNVINPDDVVTEYGADTLRIYEMFMGPFDQSAAWDTHGIKGSQRFLRRVWSLFANVSRRTPPKEEISDELALHMEKTVKKVAEATEQFKFNTAVAALMELLNNLEKSPALSRKIAEIYVLLLSPYAPHLCEELWQRFGHAQSLAYQPWPLPNEAIIKQAAVTIPLQVNGKVRGTVTVAPGLSRETLEKQARAIENISRHLAGKEVAKVVYVPDKLLNFVIKE